MGQSRLQKQVLIGLPLLLIVGAAVFLRCFNQEGDVLQIKFETEKGSLYMEIKAPDGTSVYRGNGKETTDFTVNIPESGVYPIVVEARHAKGTIHIQLKEEERQ